MVGQVRFVPGWHRTPAGREQCMQEFTTTLWEVVISGRNDQQNQCRSAVMVGEEGLEPSKS
jgi:hypothetical protein